MKISGSCERKNSLPLYERVRVLRLVLAPGCH